MKWEYKWSFSFFLCCTVTHTVQHVPLKEPVPYSIITEVQNHKRDSDRKMWKPVHIDFWPVGLVNLRCLSWTSVQFTLNNIQHENACVCISSMQAALPLLTDEIWFSILSIITITGNNLTWNFAEFIRGFYRLTDLQLCPWLVPGVFRVDCL